MSRWSGTEGGDQQRRQDTRRALLRAAQQLFVERGYRDTAVNDIVRAAGVSQGTFYLYFPNKPGIVLALMESSSEHLQEIARRWLASEPEPAGAIAGFIAEMAAFFSANKSSILVLFREVEEQPVAEGRQRYNVALREILTPAIAKGIAAGRFRDEDPGLLALMLVETAFALAYRLTLSADETIPAGIAEKIATFCVAALAPRDSATSYPKGS
jgi:AcrR family transcriptional regulator